MKKRIFSAILAGAMLCTALGSLVGCKDDPNDFSKLKTDAEMYKAIQTSLVNTQKYEGDVTFKVSSVGESYEGDKQVFKSAQTSLVAVDFDGKMYQEMKYDHANTMSYTLRETKGKAFKQDGKYYAYENYFYTTGRYKEDGSQVEGPKTNSESYTEASAAQFQESIQGYASMMNEAGTDLGAGSYADLKKAYSDVFASQVAEAKKTNENIKASNSFSLKNESGKITLKQTVTLENMRMTVVAQGGTTKDVATALISAKNGKITEFSCAYESTTTLDGVVRKDSEDIKIGIDYSFDSKAYDALETTLPETVEKEPRSNDITFVFDELEYEAYAYGYETAAEGFADACAYIPYAMSVFEIYSDEALTKKIDVDEMTVEQFDELDRVYAKAVVPERKAYIAKCETERSALSKTYETVFGYMVNTEKNWELEGLIDVNADATQNVYMLQLDEGVKAYVNGTEVTGNSFTYTSGFYKVVYVTEVTDEDCSIFKKAPLFIFNVYSPDDF